MARPSSNRIGALDSIRGLAALFVLMGHARGVFAWPLVYTCWTGWPLLSILVDGRSAVTMFFVLSGFVLARPFLAASPKTMFVPGFYVRRITRIWLPWFFVFVASLAARHWLMPGNPPGGPSQSHWLAGFWHQKLSWGMSRNNAPFNCTTPRGSCSLKTGAWAWN